MADFSRTYLIIVLAVFMVVIPSCIYDKTPLCQDEKVEFAIVNDWKDSPNAAPEGMAYLFYREGVSSPWRFDFPGRDAGTVALEPGEYKFVMYNDDTSDVIFETGDGCMPFVTTVAGHIRIESRDIEIYESPDMMWSGFIGEVKVSHDGVEYTLCDSMAGSQGSYTIVTTPRQITPVYTVRALHVDNLQGVVRMKGILSGMALGIELYGQNESEKAVDVSFAPCITSDSILISKFNTFGLPSNYDSVNELRLYFLLSDGRVVGKVYDVTNTIITAPDPMNVEITLDSISLPYAPSASEGGAFDPTVAGWTTIVVNYGT